jgi:pseudouridine synthase
VFAARGRSLDRARLGVCRWRADFSELGSRIKPDAEITISKEATKDQAKQVTILLNKPVGYVSGQPEPGLHPGGDADYGRKPGRQSGDPEFKPWMLRGLAPAGRLDIDSTGLLVLTQDGRVAKKLIGEDSQAEKEYLVRVSGEMIPGGLALLQHGLELDGKPLKQAWVKQLNEDQLHFILREGKKRQIRRMCELVGLRVIGLKRVRIGRSCWAICRLGSGASCALTSLFNVFFAKQKKPADFSRLFLCGKNQAVPIRPACCGIITVASPSMTTVSPTLQMVSRMTRFLAAMTSLTVTVVLTVSPGRTGALNFRVCAR